MKQAEARASVQASEEKGVYEAWVDGGCKTGVAVPVLVGDPGPWASLQTRSRKVAKSGAPTHAEWRRTRRLPVRLLVPRLNDGGDALQMAFELIAERCWRDNPVHKAARKTLAEVGGARACIRLLEAEPAAGRYTAVHARALTLLVM